MLIDTNVLIWYGRRQKQLNERVSRLMRQQGNAYSYVSVWEMAIKSGLGKLKLRAADNRPSTVKQFMLRMVRELQLSALPLEFDDLAEVETLPLHHRDPFDRLLIVQARRHNLAIVSADSIFEQYGVKVVW